MFEGVDGLTTQALRETRVEKFKYTTCAIGALGIGSLIGGGETPLAIMAEVGVAMPSPELKIPRLKETPYTCELKGRIWTNIGSLKSIRGVL